MKSYAAIVFLLFVTCRVGSAETGCPDAEDIAPCVCTNSPTTYLDCKNIDEAETLRNVFINSARYTYNEVHLEYSDLQYLPHHIFDSVAVNELYLVNVTLSQLFDSPPKALGELHKLHIENTEVLRSIIWKLLKPLKGLKVLEIYGNSIRVLGKDFSKYAPKELEHISLYATETQKIQKGVFAEFTNLDNLAVVASKLGKLSRDILPVPFNGRILYFNDNKLSEIPDDMFSQMPNLQTLGLRNNGISTLPQSAFQGTGSKLEYLMLDGNPMKCDCRILWLIRNKPPALSGTCVGPKKLHGWDMQDVKPSDMNC